MILLIDNYDSFTYNLVQYFGELGERVEVVRNDQITVREIQARAPKAIVISPGPCTPDEAGVSLEVVRELGGKVPVLGVCLGHQAIIQAFGGKVVQAERLMHGKTSPIYHDGKALFSGIPSPFTATRYHSLIGDRAQMPESLEISAWTEEGEVMGVRHREYPIEGVQFHPESILTQYGKELLNNFLKTYCG